MSNIGDDMPWGDGTGPAGLGPMTGRGLGYCAGFSSPGYIRGLGLRYGRGRGWGRRGYYHFYRPPVSYRKPYIPPVVDPLIDPYVYRRPMYLRESYYPQYSTEDEIKYLKNYADSLKEELEEIEKRIEELESE